MRYLGGDERFFELWLHHGVDWIRDVMTGEWTRMKREPLDKADSAKELERERRYVHRKLDEKISRSRRQQLAEAKRANP